MAKKVKLVGTGITAREKFEYSGDDFREGLDAMFGRIGRAFEEGGSGFGVDIAMMVSECRAVLKEAGPAPYPDHSPEDYSHRMLLEWERARRAVEAGNSKEAAICAFSAGYLYAEAAMKEAWEGPALKGKALLRGECEKQTKDHVTRMRTLEVFQRARSDGMPYKQAIHHVAETFGITDEAARRRVTRANESVDSSQSST